MFARRAHRQLTTWIAAWAMLLASLLPVLSHAVVSAPTQGRGWVEVCTVSGMAWVKQAVADDARAAGEDSAPGAHRMPVSDAQAFVDRCDWCATHNPLAGVPAVAAAPVLPLVFGPDVPPAFLQAPRPLFVWAAAQSRAPPAFA